MVRVDLAVYDLSRGMASALSQQILGQRIDGIWHTGIVVNNIEYYFGGGIQQSQYGAFTQQSQLPCLRLENMGETTKTQAEIQGFLQSVRHTFSAATYDLINNNCNNFSNALCTFLTGHGIPSYIIDLPRIVFSTPGGQMLRPLVDSMQAGIQQQRGTMDPFGGASAQQAQPLSSAGAAPAAFTSALANGVQSTVASITQVGPPQAANIDDKPLVSNDRSSIAALGSKLLNLAGEDGVKGSLLSASEQALLHAVIDDLVAATPADSAPFNAESFRLLATLISTQPTAQMASLFLLRLMVLHNTPHLDSEHVAETVDIILQKLTDSQSGFTSNPVKVMALCTLANLLSHERGKGLLMGQESTFSKVVDVAVTNLSHERPEMRQMASALANNVAISIAAAKVSTEANVASSSDNSMDDGEVSPAGVQLLLACLENLDTEADKLVRKRKLAIVCRIIRAFGGPALTLANDLEFGAAISGLLTNNTAGLDEHERQIATELAYAIHT